MRHLLFFYRERRFMTLQEAHRLFHISKKDLKSYEEKGLLTCRKYPDGTCDYEEKDLQRACLICSLMKAEMETETIRQYLSLMEQGEEQERIQLLRKQRCRLLERLHEKQKSLDILDYMIYEIKKGRK